MALSRTLIIQITIATVVILGVYLMFSSNPPVANFSVYHPRGIRKSLRRPPTHSKHTFAKEHLEFSSKAQEHARKRYQPIVVEEGQEVQPLELKIDQRVRKVKQNYMNTGRDAL
ncbi:hypothetical protein BSL78_13449 [Apostichopus japonicus]|uniref:Uncharacterized protein n=1 Tax=Stichopus japonicus TaxID=307972 RepID=A0A2G8KNU2_STIJA|nr:hypothetical protein BSL78_13449 [Apostichopus japonicus]